MEPSEMPQISSTLDPNRIHTLQIEAVAMYDRLNTLAARTRQKQTRKVKVVLNTRRWYKRLLWRLLQNDLDVQAQLKPKKVRRLEAASELACKLFVALGNFEEEPTPVRAQALEAVLAESKEFLS